MHSGKENYICPRIGKIYALMSLTNKLKEDTI